MKKYEAVVREVSVDIYVSYFSKLPIPAEDLKSYAMIIEGIRVLTPEALLIFKQNAEKDRSHSIKGQKDRVDILNLLVNGNINLRKYKRILDKYTLENYAKRLLKITRSMRKEFSYLGIDNPRKVKLVKKDLVNRIREI